MTALHTTLPLPSRIRQIDGLQVLRAVAVGMVAWFHACELLTPFTNRSMPGFGVYGVDIFFVISGFIISSVVLRTQQQHGPNAMREFLTRRLLRIFPIYWVFAVLRILRLLRSHQLSQHNYVPAFFLLPGLRYPEIPLLVDFSWTMMFEMFFYYLLALILLGTVRRAVPALIALLCVAVLVGRIAGIQKPIWIIACNPILLEFVLGAILALCYHRFQRRRTLGLAVTVAGVVVSFYLLAFPPHGADGLQAILTDNAVLARVSTWGMAATLLVGGVVFWSPEIRTRPRRIAMVLGNASYSAYLASALVIEYGMRLLLNYFGNSRPFSMGRVLVYQTTVTVAVFAVGWACYQFIEWPMLRWLQVRFLSKPGGPAPVH